MLDPNNKLNVMVDNVGTFTDHSDSAQDYLRDDFSIDIDPSTDNLYIGFYKPFGTVFAELVTGNTNTDDLVMEYWDGTTWESVTPSDETNGLSRSGFIFWDKSLMQSTSVNGIDKYFVRMRPPATSSTISLRGLNLVFSDDNTLKQENFQVASEACLFAEGFTSHIVAHVGARNQIVQLLRNLGYMKCDENNVASNVTYWDIMDIIEIRQAATYLVLSNIFFRMSDSQESVYWDKYMEYQSKFKESFRLASISLDLNDDGQKDSGKTVTNGKSFRWTR